MLRRALGVAVALLVLGAAPAGAFVDDEDELIDCLEETPHAIAVPIGAPRIDVHVHVLLDDGVSRSDAAANLAIAQQSYAPLGLQLVATYQPVSLTGDDAQVLIDQTKAKLGGRRPPWSHLVYTFTNKDIRLGPAGNAVAGYAPCIGGIAFPDRAFAIGEMLQSDFAANIPAKIAGHEMGHLFGAHHHYANCAEGAGGPVFEICTLMFNDVGLIGLNFATLNAAVVRGHAEEFAGPVGPPPGSEPQPTPTPTPSPTPAGSPSPTPTATATATSTPGDESAPPAGSPTAGPGHSERSGPGTPTAACAAARVALSRARRGERSARRGRARARTAVARRRAKRLVSRRTLTRRRAERVARRAC